jgi:hypothetical protein
VSARAPERAAGQAKGGTDLDRRRLIAAALAVSAGALAWRRSPAEVRAPHAPATDVPPSDAPPADLDPAATALLGILAAPAAAARLGAAYLAAHPDEADMEVLVQQLSRALVERTGAFPKTRAAMLSALTALVAEEYVTATPVRADGWLLAPSEARLYALAAMGERTARAVPVDAPDSARVPAGRQVAP